VERIAETFRHVAFVKDGPKNIAQKKEYQSAADLEAKKEAEQAAADLAAKNAEEQADRAACSSSLERVARILIAGKGRKTFCTYRGVLKVALDIQAITDNGSTVSQLLAVRKEESSCSDDDHDERELYNSDFMVAANVDTDSELNQVLQTMLERLARKRYPWMHGPLARAEAALVLARNGNINGSFLVHQKLQEEAKIEYVLSLIVGGAPVEYVIQSERSSTKNRFFFQTSIGHSSPRFGSVTNLINYYQHERGGLPIQLGQFCEAPFSSPDSMGLGLSSLEKLTISLITEKNGIAAGDDQDVLTLVFIHKALTRDPKVMNKVLEVLQRNDDKRRLLSNILQILLKTRRQFTSESRDMRFCIIHRDLEEFDDSDSSSQVMESTLSVMKSVALDLIGGEKGETYCSLSGILVLAFELFVLTSDDEVVKSVIKTRAFNLRKSDLCDLLAFGVDQLSEGKARGEFQFLRETALSMIETKHGSMLCGYQGTLEKALELNVLIDDSALMHQVLAIREPNPLDLYDILKFGFVRLSVQEEDIPNEADRNKAYSFKKKLRESVFTVALSLISSDMGVKQCSFVSPRTQESPLKVALELQVLTDDGEIVAEMVAVGGNELVTQRLTGSFAPPSFGFVNARGAIPDKTYDGNDLYDEDDLYGAAGEAYNLSDVYADNTPLGGIVNNYARSQEVRIQELALGGKLPFMKYAAETEKEKTFYEGTSLSPLAATLWLGLADATVLQVLKAGLSSNAATANSDLSPLASAIGTGRSKIVEEILMSAGNEGLHYNKMLTAHDGQVLCAAIHDPEQCACPSKSTLGWDRKAFKGKEATSILEVLLYLVDRIVAIQPSMKKVLLLELRKNTFGVREFRSKSPAVRVDLSEWPRNLPASLIHHALYSGLPTNKIAKRVGNLVRAGGIELVELCLPRAGQPYDVIQRRVLELLVKTSSFAEIPVEDFERLAPGHTALTYTTIFGSDEAAASLLDALIKRVKKDKNPKDVAAFKELIDHPNKHDANMTVLLYASTKLRVKLLRKLAKLKKSDLFKGAAEPKMLDPYTTMNEEGLSAYEMVLRDRRAMGALLSSTDGAVEGNERQFKTLASSLRRDPHVALPIAKSLEKLDLPKANVKCLDTTTYFDLHRQGYNVARTDGLGSFSTVSSLDAVFDWVAYMKARDQQSQNKCVATKWDSEAVGMKGSGAQSKYGVVEARVLPIFQSTLRLWRQAIIAVRFNPAATATEIFDNPTLLVLFVDARDRVRSTFQLFFVFTALHLICLCSFVAETIGDNAQVRIDIKGTDGVVYRGEETYGGTEHRTDDEFESGSGSYEESGSYEGSSAASGAHAQFPGSFDSSSGSYKQDTSAPISHDELGSAAYNGPGSSSYYEESGSSYTSEFTPGHFNDESGRFNEESGSSRDDELASGLFNDESASSHNDEFASGSFYDESGSNNYDEFASGSEYGGVHSDMNDGHDSHAAHPLEANVGTAAVWPRSMVPLMLFLAVTISIRVGLAWRFHKNNPSAAVTGYFAEFWVIVKFMYLIIQFVALMLLFVQDLGTCTTVAGIASLFGFVDLFYYLQWFSGYAALIRMLQHCLFGLARFFVILGLFVVGTTMLMFSMQRPRSSLVDGISCAEANGYDVDIENGCPLTWLDMLYHMYVSLLINGEIDEHLERLQSSTLAKIEWVPISVVAYILILNVLISLLNDLYEQIKERESIEVLAMQNMMVFDMTQRRAMMKWIFSPATDFWEGRQKYDAAKANRRLIDDNALFGVDMCAIYSNVISAPSEAQPLYYVHVLRPANTAPKDMLLRESAAWTGMVGKINKDAKRNYDGISEKLDKIQAQPHEARSGVAEQGKDPFSAWSQTTSTEAPKKDKKAIAEAALKQWRSFTKVGGAKSKPENKLGVAVDHQPQSPFDLLVGKRLAQLERKVLGRLSRGDSPQSGSGARRAPPPVPHQAPSLRSPPPRPPLARPDTTISSGNQRVASSGATLADLETKLHETQEQIDAILQERGRVYEAAAADDVTRSLGNDSDDIYGAGLVAPVGYDRPDDSIVFGYEDDEDDMIYGMADSFDSQTVDAMMDDVYGVI
jgi:hypothetical protein